jgi:hypothetical protein
MANLGWALGWAAAEAELKLQGRSSSKRSALNVRGFKSFDSKSFNLKDPKSFNLKSPNPQGLTGLAACCLWLRLRL